MAPDNISWLHVEASSRCNAKCPSCSRYVNDNEINPLLTEVDLDPYKFQTLLDRLNHLTCIQFNGNHGDPIISKNIVKLIKIAKNKTKKIQIHTNGSLRNASWWKDFAILLKDIEHEVYFGIDGLEDTHHLYRRDTSFNKVMQNSKSFIDNGGRAVWFFIPFKHNENQIKSALYLSKQMGFCRFELYKGYRGNNPSTVKNLETNMTYSLEPPQTLLKLIPIKNRKKQVDINDCMHYNLSSIYMNAQGKLSYCCYYMSLESKYIIEFDTLEELLNNKIDLNSKHCIISCG